jgi:uncharacterized protein (UPF0332 family)
LTINEEKGGELMRHSQEKNKYSNRFTKENQKRIYNPFMRQAVNLTLNLGCTPKWHRDKAYDLNKEADLIEALERTMAEYMDISYYSNTILQMNENFDESMEVFRPNVYLALCLGQERLKVNLFEERYFIIADVLAELDSYFNELEEEIKEDLLYLFGQTINIKMKPLQTRYFNEGIAFDSEESIAEFINDAVSNIHYYFDEYSGTVQHSTELFIRCLKEYELNQEV